MFYIICFLLIEFVKFLLIILPVLLSVAYLTLLERKILASIQRRRGPSLIGFFGLLQPLADGLKLFLKESILPMKANILIFILSPILTFFLSLLGWAILPLGPNFVLFSNINLSILYIFVLSSLIVYGIIMAGWSSNSKYAFLGAIRSSAQMISYEVSIGIIILTLSLNLGSLNFLDFIYYQKDLWFIFLFYPIFFLFFISSLAETSRAPFDLPEAESELVSGYNVEYSAVGFAFFFIAEYANIILMSIVNVILFFGGWFDFGMLIPESSILNTKFVFLNIYFFKILFFLFLFIWVRSALPRYRYDQLMDLGWKIFLPISLGIYMFCSLTFFVLNNYFF